MRSGSVGRGEFDFPAGISRSWCCRQEQDVGLGWRRPPWLAGHISALNLLLEPKARFAPPLLPEAAALSHSSSLPFLSDFPGTPAWPSSQTPAGAWLRARPAAFGPKPYFSLVLLLVLHSWLGL